MIDFSSVQSFITTAIADFLAGGLLLLGAFAAIWGIKQVMALFAGEKSTSHSMPSYGSNKSFSVNDHIDKPKKR